MAELNGTGALISGAGQATESMSTSSGLDGSIVLQDTGGAPYNGGGVIFAAGQGSFASIKGALTNGGGNTQGDLVIATRRNSADDNLTPALVFEAGGDAHFRSSVEVPTASVTTNDGNAASMAAIRNLLNYVTPEMFGYDPGSSSMDAQPAIQAALDTGKTVELGPYQYYVRTPITINSNNQIVRGQGRARTSIFANGDFPSNSTNPQAVVILSSNAGFYELRDFAISFGQSPNPSGLSDIIQYPPAIFVRDTQFKIESMQISNGYTGIDMRGNTGQSVIKDVYMSVYSVGFLIDGAVDSIRFHNLHFWPYGMTAAQEAVFFANAVGLDVGRMDNLVISDSLFIGRLGIAFHYSVQTANPGGCFANLTNVDFDTHSGITLTGGSGFTASSCNFSIGDNTSQAVVIYQDSSGRAGTAAITTSDIFVGPPAANANQDILVNCANGSLQVNNCQINSLNNDCTIMKNSGGLIVFTNNSIAKNNDNRDYRLPIVKTSGRSIILGNFVSDRGQGSGDVFILVDEDNFNNVTDNVAPGWNIPIPANAGAGGGQIGIYTGNVLRPDNHQST